MNNNNQTISNEIKNSLKLKLKDTVYKINDIKGETLEELKVLSFNKFGLYAKKCTLVAKIPNSENFYLKNDEDVLKAISLSESDKKGRKVLNVKLEEIMTVSIDICFENWKNLTDSEKKMLKEKAKLKAEVIENKKAILSGCSDEEMKEKAKRKAEVIENKKAIWSGSSDEEKKDLIKQKISKHGNFNKGSWDKETWTTYKNLCSKFPKMPEMLIGKIMKKKPKKTTDELYQCISQKIEKFELKTDEQKEKYSELRKTFPYMPEFFLNRIIIEDPDYTMEQLTKKGMKVREMMIKKKKGSVADKMCENIAGQDGKQTFMNLLEKFPDFPKDKIGKMMKKNLEISE